MHLSPKEIDKLLLHNVGFLAQKRYARGVLLNYPETVALLTAQLLEFIRDGKLSVAELMNQGKQILGFEDVMPEVPSLLHEVQVEGTFPDGTKLITVHSPICQAKGNSELALYGSFLEKKILKREAFRLCSVGKYEVVEGDIELNKGRETIKLYVSNQGDRPIQVGSHYPFFETNSELLFDRPKAFGYRLNIPSGTAVRFEPGEEKEVCLVKIAGKQNVYGGNALISGSIDLENKMRAVENMSKNNFLSKE